RTRASAVSSALRRSALFLPQSDTLAKDLSKHLCLGPDWRLFFPWVYAVHLFHMVFPLSYSRPWLDSYKEWMVGSLPLPCHDADGAIGWLAVGQSRYPLGTSPRAAKHGVDRDDFFGPTLMDRRSRGEQHDRHPVVGSRSRV